MQIEAIFPSRGPVETPRQTSAKRLVTGLRAGAIYQLAWCLLTILTQSGSRSRETIFFQSDVLWLFADVVVLLVLSTLPLQRLPLADMFNRWGHSRWCARAIALAAMAAAMIGTQLVFHGFAFTQDEMLARFDATIFRHGLTLAPLPEAWRPFWAAFQPSVVQPSFILNVEGNSAWASTYLPVNAAIHALLGNVLGFDIASPVLFGIAICASGSIARRLWPERPDASLVTMLLLATSHQALFNASTPFATTAHLTFNLLWLAFFLRGGAIAHASALLIALLAFGLHQLIFHPLFAAPFVIQLWTQRRWRLAALYSVSYLAIGLFWIFYWQLMLSLNGLHGLGRASHGMAPFLGEVVELLKAFSWSGIDLMAKNLTRFLAWQNPIVVPLAFIGIFLLRRFDSPLAALAIGLVLTTIAMFVLLPLQAFGWGYRYLHGFVGSLCLLAAAGWVLVVPIAGRAGGEQGRAFGWASLGLASAFSCLVLLPMRAFEVRAWVAPYMTAEQAIQTAPTDLVFVDTDGVGFGALLIRNDPFLKNRPIVMNLAGLTPADVSTLCKGHSASLFDERDAERFGLVKMDLGPEPDARDELARLGCGAPLPMSQPR